MLHACDDPVRGQEPLDRAAIAHRLAPEHLKCAQSVVATRLVHDGVRQLADLPLDRERADRLAGGNLFLREQRRQVAYARVDLAALVEDDIERRVQSVPIEAALGERLGEAPPRRRPPDLGRIEPEESLAQSTSSLRA